MLAHSKMVKAISYGEVKTDKVDARTLAELLRVDLIPQAHQASPKRRELRELTRGRLRMIQWRSKLQSTLWGLAAKYNVQINGTQWRYPSKLQQWLLPQLPAAANLQAQIMLGQIRQLQSDIHRLEEEIEQQSTFNEAAERLMAVPGLGKVGVWTILAEIGDITRFRSAKQFVSYCRLVPGAKDSGGSHRHKSGNKTPNKSLAITRVITSWVGNYELELTSCLFCLEPTGPYSHQLKQTLLSLEANVWEASSLSIHLSKGLVRGKSDPLDARQIVLYTLRYRDQVRLLGPGNIHIDHLSHLLRLRQLLVEDRSKYRQRLGELSRSWDREVAPLLAKNHSLVITQMETQIKEIEQRIDQLLTEDKDLRVQFEHTAKY